MSELDVAPAAVRCAATLFVGGLGFETMTARCTRQVGHEGNHVVQWTVPSP